MRFVAVRNLRESAVEHARKFLGVAERLRATLESERAALCAERDRARLAPTPPEWRNLLLAFELRMGAAITAKDLELAEAARQCELARSELGTRIRELKAIQVLMERDARERSRQEQRREDRQAAERAASTHHLDRGAA